MSACAEKGYRVYRDFIPLPLKDEDKTECMSSMLSYRIRSSKSAKKGGKEVWTRE